MITSPKQYDPDSRAAKLDRAISTLKITKNVAALAVCQQVADGNENLKAYDRLARIALAANQGYTNALIKRIEGR